MNCDRFQEHFSSFYDDELKPSMADKMRLHLSHCADCQRLLSSQTRLSDMVRRADIQSKSQLTWEAMSKRLDVAESVTEATKVERRGRSERSTAIQCVLALAAVALLLVGMRLKPQDRLEGDGAIATATIDLRPVVESFSRGAEHAMESVASLFPKTASDRLSASENGIDPAKLSLPDGVSLVSMNVVRLPFCSCLPGKCHCGPGGCDCIAGLVQRADGSRFLILEHCDAYKVRFGNGAPEQAQHSAKGYQSITLNHVLAVSWEQNDRRLTAIGLRNESEGSALVSSNVSLDL
ncbi:MAG: anti-sigma factor family protein [Planctomycetaceae bacterium]